MTCETIIDMRRPVGAERVRGFQPPWRTVYVYRCAACGAEHRVRASSFRGATPEPLVGGMYCGATLRNEGGNDA
jgi:hypothetical protein